MIAILIPITSGFQTFDQDQDSSDKATAESMIIDFFVLRPLGLAVTAVGTVVFIGSLPFSVTGDNTTTAFQKLIIEPAAYTFKRPLGKLEDGIQD